MLNIIASFWNPIAIAFAQVPQSSALPTINNVNDLSNRAISIGNVVVYLLIGLAVVYIVWNGVQMAIHGDESDKRTAAVSGMMWGVVGLAIIVSLWGLVAFLTNSFAVTPTQQRLPQFITQ